MSPTKTKAPRVAKKIKPTAWSKHVRDVNVVWYNVSDWARAKKFYSEVLGLPVAFGADEMGWMEFGHPDQTHLAINLWRGPEAKPPAIGGATATFACDNVRKAFEEWRAKGVRCDEPEDIAGTVILGSFYDPEGNRLQLAQSLAPAA